MNNTEKIPPITIMKGIETLCRIFWGPDPDQCGSIFRGELTSFLEPVEYGSETGISDSLNKLKSLLNSFEDPDSLCAALNEEYISLFISHRDGIAAPLYESCYEYEGAPLMGEAAVRMKTLLESAGLALGEDFREPPDHLSIELEYLYFLLNKAKEGSCDYREASEFVSGIMIPWIGAFYEKLRAENPESFYTLSAYILLRLLGFIRDTAFLND